MNKGEKLELVSFNMKKKDKKELNKIAEKMFKEDKYEVIIPEGRYIVHSVKEAWMVIKKHRAHGVCIKLLKKEDELKKEDKELIERAEKVVKELGKVFGF